MKWLAIKRGDGSTDPYCIGFVTYTVARVSDGFSAWRLKHDSPGELLGVSDTAAGAKLLAEQDARKHERA